MFKFNNRASLHFFLIFFSNLFNDWYSFFVGFPTPTQIVLLFGIYDTYIRYPLKTPEKFRLLKSIFYIYLLIIFISTLVLYIETNKFPLNVFTIGINLIWLFGIVPHAYKGISQNDFVKSSRYILISILLLAVGPGLYEFVTHSPIIPEFFYDNFFYLKGLTADKLEFAGILSFGVLLSLQIFYSNIKINNLILILSFCFGIILVLFSFSNTSQLGLLLSIIVVFRRKLIKFSLFVLTISFFGFVFFDQIKELEIFQGQLKAYEVKYQLNVETSEDNNFRLLAMRSALVTFQKYPILGHGPEMSAFVTQDYLASDFSAKYSSYEFDKPVSPHNIFANEIIDYGLLGLFFIMIVLFQLYQFTYLLLFYSKRKLPDYVAIIVNLSIGLSFFLIPRFILYYHRFDQTIYFIWILLIVLAFGTIKQLILEEGLKK